MTRLLTALVGLLLVSSTAAPVAIGSRQAGLPLSIPFELATRHIIVKGSVNNSRPLSFVLDTGAGVAIVRMNVAGELGLSLQGSVNTGGAGPGTQAGQRVKDAKWSLVGFETFAQPVTLALPLPLLPTGLGRDVDGIIGGEFIKQFVAELDYQARVLTLHDPATFVYRGSGEVLPLDFTQGGHPVLKATVVPAGGGQPIEGRFMFDIGSGLALALHTPFVAEHNLLSAQSKTIRAIGMAGAGGKSIGRLGRVSAVRIGSATIDNPVTLFSQDQAGAFANRSLAGNIGAQIAAKFRLFLDYGRKRIILEPAPAFAEPFDRAFSGMAVRAEGDDYRTFLVQEVLEDSPATDAGIAEGDIIASIDGQSADTFTLSAVQELFEKPVTYALTIKRGAETITVTLTPRKLL